MKKFQFRLPRLRRRGKILRNLLVTLFLLTLIWGQFGCPLFWPEWEFRRAERRLLLPPSEIVLHVDMSGGGYREGGPRPWRRTNHQFIGLGDGYAVAIFLYPRSPSIWAETWDLSAQTGSVKLVSVPSFYADWRKETEKDFIQRYMLSSGVAALELPDGTVRGELAVEYADTVYRADSTVDEAGVCLFSFEQDWPEGINPRSSSWFIGLPYTLRLYGGDGALLLEQTGNIPDADSRFVT